MCRVQGGGISARSRGPHPPHPRDLALIPLPCTLHTPYRCMYNWLISFLFTTWRWPTFVAETCSCALHIINSVPPNLLVVFDDIHMYLIVWLTTTPLCQVTKSLFLTSFALGKGRDFFFRKTLSIIDMGWQNVQSKCCQMWYTLDRIVMFCWPCIMK